LRAPVGRRRKQKGAFAGKGIVEFETFNLPIPAAKHLRHISLCMKR